MAKVITLASGKGGVGKSTCCANLALALAALGKKTLAIDCDFGLRNLDLILQLEQGPVFTIEDCIRGRCTAQQAAVAVEENLFFLAPPFYYEESSISKQEMEDFISSLRGEYDYILLDSPAGILKNAQLAACGAQMALLVVTPDGCSARDADRAAAMLEKQGVEEIQLVVNRVEEKHLSAGFGINVDDLMDDLGLPLLGVVPEDEAILKQKGRAPVGSRARQAYQNIARRLEGEDVPIMSFEKKSWLRRIFG